MNRQEALRFLTGYLKDERMVKHCIAVGAIMRDVARKLKEDENLWELTGLLHDIDYDVTNRDMTQHGLDAIHILKGLLPEVAIDAIASHNEHNGHTPGSPEAERLTHALRSSDHASGLIIATALVMPNKRLAEVKLDSLMKKFKQKDFARGVDRSRLRECELLGLSLEEFLAISLESMKKVAGELGL
ncbi:MAG: HDIG domain-containing protein [Thermofilaceae archaeon]